jgi:hypothetical protein
MQIETESTMKRRLKWALQAYGALALLAFATLDGNFLYFILILLCALALKSWIAVQRESID